MFKPHILKCSLFISFLRNSVSEKPSAPFSGVLRPKILLSYPPPPVKTESEHPPESCCRTPGMRWHCLFFIFVASFPKKRLIWKITRSHVSFLISWFFANFCVKLSLNQILWSSFSKPHAQPTRDELGDPWLREVPLPNSSLNPTRVVVRA